MQKKSRAGVTANSIAINSVHAGVMRTGAQGEAGTDQAAEHLQSHAPNALLKNSE